MARIMKVAMANKLVIKKSKKDQGVFAAGSFKRGETIHVFRGKTVTPKILYYKDFYQVSLKIILKNQRGEVLLLQAIDNGSYAGYYDLPGGRIDVDEFRTDLPKIIGREIREEIGEVKYKLNEKPAALGRHLIPGKYLSDKKDIHCFYVFFEADYIKGEIKVSPEHTGYKWVDLKKMKLADYFKSGILEGLKMYLGR